MLMDSIAMLPKLRMEITNCAQSEAENLHEAWERFKKLLRKCPQHNLAEAEQIAKFYVGLLYSVKSTLDAAANREFDALPPQSGKELIEKVAARAVNTVFDRQGVKRVFEVKAIDQIIASKRKLAKQMFEMQKQFQKVKLLHSNFAPKCVTCGGPNCGQHCIETPAEEEEKYMGQAPFSNNYNSWWKNHPNFSWRDQGNDYQKSYNNQNFQGQRPQEQGKSSGKKSIEELLEGFIARVENDSKQKNAAIKNLEVQVG